MWQQNKYLSRSLTINFEWQQEQVVLNPFNYNFMTCVLQIDLTEYWPMVFCRALNYEAVRWWYKSTVKNGTKAVSEKSCAVVAQG